VGLSAPPRAQAGELLELEALDLTGLAVRSDGALVRAIEVQPANPLVMDAAGRQRLSEGLRALCCRLAAGESLQFYVESLPLALEELAEGLREQVRACAGPPPSPAGATDGALALALARWRLCAAMEQTLRAGSQAQAAVRLGVHVIVAHAPPRRSRWPRGAARGSARRTLAEHRAGARASLARCQALCAELEALGLPARIISGPELAALIWRRFNPTRADLGSQPRLCVHGELDGPVGRERARASAIALREQLAQSAIDFTRSRQTIEIDSSLEQVIYAASIAEQTHLGMLLGAMGTRAPYVLSVFVRALDRRAERARIKARYRRTFAVNRGREARGRVPDFDAYEREHEAEQVLGEMAADGSERVFAVSVYQALRATGPAPEPQQLAEAVDWCSEQLAQSGMRVSRGSFEQQPLWRSTLPLGLDAAARRHRYLTRNLDGLIPLVSGSCGSPEGLPFAICEPGRTLERLDPYDRAHPNQVMLIAGRSGSGKTMAACTLLGRLVALGARAVVIDRAGHYATLASLIPGGLEIAIGADGSRWAINPWECPDPANPGLEKIAMIKALHGALLGGLQVAERAQLDAAIRACYRRAAAQGRCPRESDLRRVLTERARGERQDGSPELAALLENLAERLGEFCEEGSYAYLLDRETTVPDSPPLLIFDTRACPPELLGAAMMIIAERTRTQAAATRPGATRWQGRTVLVIDEAWHLVGREETGQWANDLARRARHLGLFLVVISQQISDFLSEHGLALLRNSSIQLLLAQQEHELAALQDALGLSDAEARIVARLRTVKGAYAEALWVNGERGRAKVQLPAGGLEYWAYTSEPLADAPRRQQAIEQAGGDVWAAIAHLAREARA